MTDGKKPDGPDAPLDNSVPTETPKLLQQDLGLDRRAPRPVPGFQQLQQQAQPAARPAANLKDTSPYFPTPAKLKEATGEHPVAPEYANTVISPRQAPPSPIDSAKTQPSAANPVLAKLQAEQRAAAAGPSRPPVPTNVGPAPLSPGVAALRPDPSLLTTDPLRPVLSSALRSQPLRQPLASRPLPAPPAKATQVTTDPMQQPDVLAAIARGEAAALPPRAAERTEVSRAPVPIDAAPQARTELARGPVPVGRPPDAGRPPGLLERTEVARPVPQPPGLAERTQVARPVPQPERTEVARPMPQVTAPPGVPMPGAATKTMPLWPAAPNAAAAQAPRVSLSPPKQVSQLDVTPLPAKEAFVAKAAAPALEPVPPPQTTAPAPPPRAFVVPPSFMDLPPAMEKPRRLGPDLATTQPGIPGPYSKPRAPFEVQDLPSTLDERAPVHGAATTSDEAVAAEQVLASPASLWRRLLASIVDLAVISLAVGGLLSVAVSIAGKPPPASLAGLDALVYGLRPIAVPALVLSALLAMLYTTLGAFLLEGRTLGRLLLGIRLVDSTGKAPGPVRSLLRALFAIVSFALFLAGFWLGLFDGKGQTLHDKLTRTFVIRPV